MVNQVVGERTRRNLVQCAHKIQNFEQKTNCNFSTLAENLLSGGLLKTYDRLQKEDVSKFLIDENNKQNRNAKILENELKNQSIENNIYGDNTKDVIELLNFSHLKVHTNRAFLDEYSWNLHETKSKCHRTKLKPYVNQSGKIGSHPCYTALFCGNSDAVFRPLILLKKTKDNENQKFQKWQRDRLENREDLIFMSSKSTHVKSENLWFYWEYELRKHMFLGPVIGILDSATCHNGKEGPINYKVLQFDEFQNSDIKFLDLKDIFIPGGLTAIFQTFDLDGGFFSN